MWNNVIISLAILTQLTGLSVPHILEEEIYLIPSYTEQNIFHWQAGQIHNLPEIEDRYKAPLKLTDDLGLDDLEARAALIQDKATGQILWQKNAHTAMPMASLTKLMTALVYLENQPEAGFNHEHTLTAYENYLIGAKLHVDAGDKVKTFDLLRATLVGSTNNGAMALAHATEMEEEEFVAVMNKKAKALGMTKTYYEDPTGLETENTSTVADLAFLFDYVLDYPEIAVPLGMREHLMDTVEQQRHVRIKNTNPLLKDETVNVTAGKTGYLDEAGYCLIIQAEDDQGHEIIAVVLGESSEDARSEELKEMIDWTFNNYQWSDA